MSVDKVIARVLYRGKISEKDIPSTRRISVKACRDAIKLKEDKRKAKNKGVAVI